MLWAKELRTTVEPVVKFWNAVTQPIWPHELLSCCFLESPRGGGGCESGRLPDVGRGGSILPRQIFRYAVPGLCGKRVGPHATTWTPRSRSITLRIGRQRR